MKRENTKHLILGHYAVPVMLDAEDRFAFAEPMYYESARPSGIALGSGAPTIQAPKIRKKFPETFIWDDLQSIEAKK